MHQVGKITRDEFKICRKYVRHAVPVSFTAQQRCVVLPSFGHGADGRSGYPLLSMRDACALHSDPAKRLLNLFKNKFCPRILLHQRLFAMPFRYVGIRRQHQCGNSYLRHRTFVGYLQRRYHERIRQAK